jgi:hypothetical protein
VRFGNPSEALEGFPKNQRRKSEANTEPFRSNPGAGSGKNRRSGGLKKVFSGKIFIRLISDSYIRAPGEPIFAEPGRRGKEIHYENHRLLSRSPPNAGFYYYSKTLRSNPIVGLQWMINFKGKQYKNNSFDRNKSINNNDIKQKEE